ncbi:MAG TPA: UDP-N-acetylmuramate dehydrogenase [Bacteroidales bacterium]|nr:UDP-N-acetylmuramate dehydrogenase [Bacteroidales bacterium]
MFVIKKDISLKPYNTFGIDVAASYYARANTVEKILYAINFASYNKLPIFVLGGGSNILFTRDFEGVIINPAIQGVQLQSDDEQYYVFRVGAGVVWDKFVELAANNNLGGVENLSHIPGLVGASPIQNIGAYGVEVKDTIVKVEAVEVSSRKLVEFNASECHFGYRDSIFKQELKEKVIITHVWFRLSRNPSFELSYGNLAEEVAKLGEVSVQNVRKAVINIRKSKLPDPAELGNAGSFFKNPIVDADKYTMLKVRHADLNGFQVSESFYKIPAGWLIEKAGWKGKQMGECGVHHKQALILVNYGGATGTDILDLASSIQRSVWEQFGIELEREVNVF